MRAKQKDVATSQISPVLFLTVDGEPMSFFLRPGPTKRKLQPLITAGGGLLCSVQQPGAILLIDPEERGSITESTAHWYVSTQYIHDCIEKDEQLNLEDYRLNPEVVPRHSARLNNSKDGSPGLSGGRIAYTTEDDAAILSYVNKHKTEVGGNRLWQEMEKQRVTSHSWQSMKSRYKVQLAKKQSEAEEVVTSGEDAEAAEEETRVEESPETDVKKAPSAGETASPQAASTESDLTQVDAQSIPAEDPQMTISPQEDALLVNSQTDALLSSPENTEPETDEPQTVMSPQKESVPEDSTPTQPKSLSDSASQKNQRGKQRASPRLEQPQRRLTRRQLQLEESSSPSQPYPKKLRSSSSIEEPSLSPQPSKKMKSAVKSALKNDSTAEQPPSKKAKGKSAAAVSEQSREESGHAAAPETTQTDTASVSVPHKGGKKKEKRRLGILELATKEFEDESESDEEEAPDLQNPSETETEQPTSAVPPLPTPNAAAPTLPEPEPGLQEIMQEAQASSSVDRPQAGCAHPVANDATSTAHLFIFDNESQEEDSQSIFGDDTAAVAEPQPAVSKDAAFSLTQAQLDEDKQRITELMNQTNQDLMSVTKALLKTSGDFSAAQELLLNPLSLSGPFWQRCDDKLLLSADPVIRQQLQEKYGEENVAKRIVFLEVEG